MNGFWLKLIAMITMLIDHTAAILIPNDTMVYMICRSIGRLAFPIYCFLLIEGFLHTNNIKKYLTRLGVFAFISEIPFDLGFYNRIIYLYHQNIFFTLFIGLTVLFFVGKVEHKYRGNYTLNSFLTSLVVLIGCVVATFLQTDYGALGVLMIAAFYFFRYNKVLLIASLIILNGLLGGRIQALAAVSMVFIWFYNGEKGKQWNKYVFYIYYPLHILMLYFIARFIVFR